MSSAPSLATSQQARSATELWTTLKSQLAAIASNHGSFSSLCRATNTLQATLQSNAEPLETLRPKLERQYEQIRREAAEDEQTLNAAIESLGALIALKNAPEPAQLLVEKRNGKKRRLDGSSPAPPDSPLPVATSAAAPSSTSGPLSSSSSTVGTVGIPSTSLAPPPVLTSMPTQLNIPASARTASPGPLTPGGRVKPARAQTREAQLYEGRPIAFKTPPAKGRPAKDADKKRVKEESVEGGTWILARIVRCIDREKCKYEVQDVDEESGSAGVYVTTMKSIVPLPDPKNKEGTFPTTAFRVGSDVLAVYPDVTALYRARVKEAPSARSNAYSVVFEGDQGAVSQVAPEYVTEWVNS